MFFSWLRRRTLAMSPIINRRATDLLQIAANRKIEKKKKRILTKITRFMHKRIFCYDPYKI